jgi:hypothetical protein
MSLLFWSLKLPVAVNGFVPNTSYCMEAMSASYYNKLLS